MRLVDPRPCKTSLYADEAGACTATQDLLSEVRAIPEAKSAVVRQRSRMTPERGSWTR